jgi:hypothetical protein
MKTEALIKTSAENLNKNHVIMIHVTHVIFIKLLDKIKIDQKIIFSSKNTIIAEKIICVLNAAIQIIQLRFANICLI